MSNFTKKWRKGIIMEKEIVEEIVKECENWKERLVVRLFPKMFVRIYGKISMLIFNNMNKNI